MNRTKIHWFQGDALPAHDLLLEALPGVGNVGKIIIDALVTRHDSTLLAWVIHPDYPPHATLDKNGFLAPPRLEIHSVSTPDGKVVITICGTVQPLTPTGQFEVATSLLELINDSDSPMLLILAGLAVEATSDTVHLVCMDESMKTELAKKGLETSTEEPRAGVIGTNALLASLAPMDGVRAACAVAETMGTAVDGQAAGRLVEWLESGFDIHLDVPVDTTTELADRIRRDLEIDQRDLEFLLGESDPTPEFYV